jgi:hypothetical protein
VRVFATNIGMSSNAGQFVGGCGGNAFGKRSNSSSVVSERTYQGIGGNVSVNVGTTSGKITGCNGSLAYWDPTTLKATNTTVIEGTDQVIIFGGNDWTMDLRELTEGAISAADTIIISVGKGGIVDLPDASSGKVFKAGTKVEIFAEKIRMGGTVLEADEVENALTALMDTPSVNVGPPKILYNVELSYANHLVDEPNTTIPVNLTVLNGGPTEDTYTISMTDSDGWDIGTLPDTVTVNSMRRSKLTFDVTLPETRGEENVITLTATSQGDPDVQAVAEIRVSVKEEEHITPRNGEKADLAVLIDDTIMMASELIIVSNAMESFLAQFVEKTWPSEEEIDAFMAPYSEENPPSDEELNAFMAPFEIEAPTVELLTFKDDVTSRVVTSDLGEVITRIRTIQASGGDDCPNASVTAIESALENINPNGQIIIATASAPHKEAATAIAKAQALGVKVHVILTGSCSSDEAAEKALYKSIADETEGTFNWLPRGITSIEEVEEVITTVITEALTEAMNKAPTIEYKASGTIRDKLGNPIAGVTVQVGDITVITNAEGIWEVAGLLEGDYTIIATKADYIFPPKNITLVEDNPIQEVRIEADDYYTAYGIIRSDSGVLKDIEVTVAGITVMSNDEGKWEVPGLQEGEYTATASKENFVFTPIKFALGNDEFEQEVVIVALSMLNVKVVAEPRKPIEGENITFITTVTIGGDKKATGIVLSQVLSSGFNLDSIEPLDGGTCDADTVICTLPNLAPGATTRVKLVVSNPEAKRSVVNTATVTSNEYPTDVHRKRVNIIPHLSVSCNCTPNKIVPEGKLDCTAEVILSALAPIAATNVKLIVTLPKGVGLQLPVDSMCDVSELPTLTCSLGELNVDSAGGINQAIVSFDELLVNPGLLVLTHHAKVTANEYPDHTDRERTKVFIPPNYLVDLVLVIDVTGSMQQEMDSAKRQLQDFIAKIDANQSPLTALVVFRDEVTVKAVTTDLNLIAEAIDDMTASGGGTCPEASVEALDVAISHVKKDGTIFFVTDASPYDDADVVGVIERLQAKNIQLHVIITGDCSNRESWNQIED